jgi:hypothetical protein
MALIEQLTAPQDGPCVTISFNTHRTHPDNLQDHIMLKKLCKEAEDRLIEHYGKRPVQSILDKIEGLHTMIDHDYNSDSMHIFVSESILEVVKLAWQVPFETVQIGDSFAVKPLLKALNRSEKYLILLFSQHGASLYHAHDNVIVEEIRNDDFPFASNPHYVTNSERRSDSKKGDNMVSEYFNKIDKAVVRAHQQLDLNCVVICTDDNYTKLIHEADKPSIYLGHVAKHYNDISHHAIVNDAWELIQSIQSGRRHEAIDEMMEAVGHGKVITDLGEIYRAAKEGRGELLIAQNNFKQSVKMIDDMTFDLVNDGSEEGTIDDITSDLAWEVFSKHGRVIFTSQEETKTLGDIALKVRY